MAKCCRYVNNVANVHPIIRCQNHKKTLEGAASSQKNNKTKTLELKETHIFFLSGFSFRKICESQDCREGGGHFFNSSLSLPLTSQALRH